MIFIESKPFDRLREQYLTDAGFRAMQAAILRNPAVGAVIPGTGGLQKLRWGMEGRGKRGGLRIIYYLVTADSRCLLLYRYPKNVQEDLGSDELRLLQGLVRVYFEARGA